MNTDDEGTYNKINSAYFTGGPTQAVKALNRNLDLNITDYVTFNWNAVADGINVLGGIDIELSNAEFYYISMPLLQRPLRELGSALISLLMRE